MKTLINLTTSTYDLDRFPYREALLSFLEEFSMDGVELLVCDPDPRGIVPASCVVGQHMLYYPYWLDFYRGDEAALMRDPLVEAAMAAFPDAEIVKEDGDRQGETRQWTKRA